MGKILKYDEKMFLSDGDKAILDGTLARLNGEKCPSGGNVAVVFQAVREHLREFCKADMEFCRSVHDSGKSISECCTEILKGVGSGISDVEVYRRAVKFYLPEADVIASINIVTHDAGTPEFPVARSRVLNLWDL